MTHTNDLNDLVNAGKDDIKRCVKEYVRRSISEGDEAEKRCAMMVSSLLSLSIKKTQPEIDVTYIRTLIIEENAAILSSLQENNTQIIRLFAVATGRVTEIREHLAALGRVEQACLNEGRVFIEYLASIKGWLGQAERAAVRISRASDGTLMLREVANHRILAPAGRILEEELV